MKEPGKTRVSRKQQQPTQHPHQQQQGQKQAPGQGRQQAGERPVAMTGDANVTLNTTTRAIDVQLIHRGGGDVAVTQHVQKADDGTVSFPLGNGLMGTLSFSRPDQGSNGHGPISAVNLSALYKASPEQLDVARRMIEVRRRDILQRLLPNVEVTVHKHNNQSDQWCTCGYELNPPTHLPPLQQQVREASLPAMPPPTRSPPPLQFYQPKVSTPPPRRKSIHARDLFRKTSADSPDTKPSRPVNFKSKSLDLTDNPKQPLDNIDENMDPADVTRYQYKAPNYPPDPRGRLVTFYPNGDAFSQGFATAVNKKVFATMEVLCQWLNTKLPLPKGVQYIFRIPEGDLVTSVEQFEPGQAYVASSQSQLVRLPYGANVRTWHNYHPSSEKYRQGEGRLFLHALPWAAGHTVRLDYSSADGYTTTRSRGGLSTRLGGTTTRRQTQGRSMDDLEGEGTRLNDRGPRIVTIISNTDRDSRQQVMINPETNQTFDEILQDVGAMIRIQQPPVSSLWTAQPPFKQIHNFKQLMEESKHNDSFIACGAEGFSATNTDDLS